MKIELKNIKTYPALSEETTAFSAEIFIDGRKAGYAKNDGHGGCTEYHSYPSFHDAILKAHEFLAEQADIVYPNSDGTGEFSVKSNMENWIDFQIANKENEKFQKKLQKDMLKGICYGNVMMYATVYWKNHTLDQLLNSPVGKELIQKKVNELKANGETILNKNLVGIVL